MTLPASYTPSSAAADGVTTDFTFNFPAISTTFIKVYSQIVATGALTPITTGFTVTENATKTGGTVAFTSAPLTAVGNIIIERETPQSQPQPLSTSKGFQAKVLEQMFDKVVAMVQERFNELSRALSFPLGTSTSVSAEIPAPVAGKAIKGASDGLSFIASTYDPDEQVNLSTAQAVIATAQAKNASASASNAAASELAAANYAASIDPSALLNKTDDKASQAQAEAGSDDTKYMTPLKTAQAMATLTLGDSMVHTGLIDLGVLTRDGNTHDLDLSAYCPAGTKYVNIAYNLTFSTADEVGYIQKNGASEALICSVRSLVAEISHRGQWICPVDDNRVIEYAMSSTVSSSSRLYLADYII